MVRLADHTLTMDKKADDRLFKSHVFRTIICGSWMICARWRYRCLTECVNDALLMVSGDDFIRVSSMIISRMPHTIDLHATRNASNSMHCRFSLDEDSVSIQ